MNSIKPALTGLTFSVTFALGAPAAYAAPGTLAGAPLFLTSTVQPNILFLVDDSGSMDWEVLKTNGAITAHGTGSNSGNLNFTPSDITEQLELCAGYNAMAYNPNVTYTPWSGYDSNGTAYKDQTLTAARTNPYLTSAINTRDLSNDFYFVWNDANSDGVYQAGECYNNTTISTASDCNNKTNKSNSYCYRVDGLSASEQTNYANWYSYYRKREYVAKRAISEITKSSSARLGLATLHNNNSVFTAVTDVDDITTPIDATAAANKTALLKNISRINSSGGTPLRQTLEEAGRYFSRTEASAWGSSPMLPDSQGGLCQQHFTVLMSDGYWNGSDPSVGNADGDASSVFDGGTTSPPRKSFGDSYANTLADVAMHYYETDISGNNHTNNQVPVLQGLDPDSSLLNNNKMHPHMNTFTVAFGIDGTLSANPVNQTDTFTWPQPVANQLSTIDDLRHAAWNGRGEFLSAGDPAALINGLNSALSAISGRTGSAASVTFNTGTLSSNSQVYLALFNSERWSGDMQAYNLDASTGAVAGSASWKAAPKLDSRDLSADDRTMLTWNGSDGVALQWADLTTPQKNDFKTNSAGGTDVDAAGIARLHYIRGDRVCETNYQGTGTFTRPDGSTYTVGASSTSSCSYTDGTNTYTAKNMRNRNSRLGDIVHSGPVYVGEPESGWSDSITSVPYSSFRDAKKNRAGMLYVGANDGMLHGFSASSASGGREVMTYVPSMIYSSSGGAGLHYLTEPGYGHKYYVDLTPSVGDAYIKTTPTGTTGWKTILVGGLRGGGRGLFALDVTNPSFTEDSTSTTTPTPADVVMWEFTDPDLGYTFSQPAIVPLENGEWAAIFGNGYNDTGSGTAQLFILYLEDGLDGTWSQVIKIDTKAGSSVNPNGLASPSVIDSDGDGLADRVYAGDLQGNMWAFDLSGSNTTSWGSAYGSKPSPAPLFKAPTNQQITSAPVVVRNLSMTTDGSTAPNTLVMFGTGQYLTTSDPTTTWNQSFYGIWDHQVGGLTTGDLIEQTIALHGGTGARTLSNNPVDYSKSPTPDHGWYIKLPTSGERIVVSPAIRGDYVYFNTMIPDTGNCTFGGTGWLMVAQWLNGARPDNAVFDLNNDGKVDNLDEINNEGAAGKKITGLPSAPVNLGNKRYVSTTETQDGSGISDDELEKLQNSDTGRLSWEELFQ